MTFKEKGDNPMKKFFAFLLSTCLIVTIFSANPVYAKNEGKPGCELLGPVCQEYSYYQARSTQKKIPYSVTTHMAKNNTGTTQSISVSATRTISFTGSARSSAEANLIAGSIGVSAEVGYGNTSSRTFQATTNVPPYTTYYCDTGSYLAKTTGSIVKVDHQCNKTYRNVNISLTTGQFAEWYK